MAMVGKSAPAFKGQALVNNEVKTISNADYAGKWLVLFFYPLDFTFVWPTELTALGERYEEFKRRGAEVISISVDSVHAHKAWALRGDLREVRYPMLSDFNKQISRDYGVLEEEKGFSLRGTFIIDPKGNVVHQSINAPGVGRSMDEILRLVDAFQTGELCPVNWKKGDSFVKPK